MLYAAAAAAKSLQSCPTLSDPMDSSLPGSSVHGSFQARLLEWVAIAFSMWVLITQPGIEAHPLALGAWSLSQWATREVPVSCYFKINSIYLALAVRGLLAARVFLYLWRARLLFSCTVWASHCGGFFCCGAWALGPAGFSS